MLPGQEGGRGGAVPARGGHARDIHGRSVGHGDGGGQLTLRSFGGLLPVAVRVLGLHLQVGSEVEAEGRNGQCSLSFSEITSCSYSYIITRNVENILNTVEGWVLT